MKLITEFLDSPIQCITEGAKDGKGTDTYLIGTFMQAEKVNRNGRIYESRILRPAVEKYVREQVLPGRAVGELGHPDGPTINLDKVSHRIVSLKWVGEDVQGKALVLDTPMGRIVKGLVSGGVQLGVSSRGMGSLERGGGSMLVKDDYVLSTVDIVQDPSAPEAFVNGIMEGVEYFWKGNELVCEDIRKTIHNATSKNLAEAQIAVFKNFLRGI